MGLIFYNGCYHSYDGVTFEKEEAKDLMAVIAADDVEDTHDSHNLEENGLG